MSLQKNYIRYERKNSLLKESDMTICTLIIPCSPISPYPGITRGSAGAVSPPLRGRPVETLPGTPTPHAATPGV